MKFRLKNCSYLIKIPAYQIQKKSLKYWLNNFRKCSASSWFWSFFCNVWSIVIFTENCRVIHALQTRRHKVDWAQDFQRNQETDRQIQLCTFSRNLINIRLCNWLRPPNGHIVKHILKNLLAFHGCYSNILRPMFIEFTDNYYQSISLLISASILNQVITGSQKAVGHMIWKENVAVCSAQLLSRSTM